MKEWIYLCVTIKKREKKTKTNRNAKWSQHDWIERQKEGHC